ncbi:MAG TPA: SDR family oxidoreductase [Pontiella sp.]|nr:SDR family oxidoreductase [Pontiella sp.]
MSVSLKGKWALVTGSSRGIGLRVARGLSALGCRVILHARIQEATDGLAQELCDAGGEVAQVAAELSDPGQVEALVQEVKNITGNSLGILYNNAAIMTPWCELYTVRAEDYATSFQVNCIAPAKLADAFIPKMIEDGFGRVVMVTSGIENEPQLMAYSCSKAALDRYVRDMVPSLEGTGVLMNIMDPGWLRTDLGGPNAPNDPDSIMPGALVPVVIQDSEGSGRRYYAQELSDYALE